MNQKLFRPDRRVANPSALRIWLSLTIVCLLLIGTAVAIWLYLPSFQISVPVPPIVTPSISTISTIPTPTPIISTTFEVFAAKGWQDSGIHVNVGDRLEVIYTKGLWTEKSGSDNYTGPEGGKPSRDYPCNPLPHSETGYNALIGKIWFGKPFMVGDHFVGTSLISGTLYLRMNDCDEWLIDNEGSVYVTIQISR